MFFDLPFSLLMLIGRRVGEITIARVVVGLLAVPGGGRGPIILVATAEGVGGAKRGGRPRLRGEPVTYSRHLSSWLLKKYRGSGSLLSSGQRDGQDGGGADSARVAARRTAVALSTQKRCRKGESPPLQIMMPPGGPSTTTTHGIDAVCRSRRSSGWRGQPNIDSRRLGVMGFSWGRRDVDADVFERAAAGALGEGCA